MSGNEAPRMAAPTGDQKLTERWELAACRQMGTKMARDIRSHRYCREAAYLNKALQPTGPEAAVFSVCSVRMFGSPVTLSAGPAAELVRYRAEISSVLLAG